MTTKEIKAHLRHGDYTDLGGYPLYFISSDGEALSFDAVRAEWRQVCYAVRNKLNDGWQVVAVEINYEDGELYCAHTGKRIQSAYAEN